MTHYETFEVLTDPSGGSNLSFRIACATAMEHYTRTMAHHEAPRTASTASNTTPAQTEAAGETTEEVCSTGLRVYAGAQVLAAFLAQYGDALVHLSVASQTQRTEGDALASASPHFTAVELGCGCGLSGFTLSSVVHRADVVETSSSSSLSPSASSDTLRVVFTDASLPCLALVRDGGALNGLPVVDGTTPSTGLARAARVTYPLSWGPQGIAALARDVLGAEDNNNNNACASVDLVIGSDLLYYRVDIVQLLDTCKRLLGIGDAETREAPTQTPHEAESKTSKACFKVAVLSHFLRIADGERKVAEAARAMGLGVVHVPLTRFLDPSVVLQASFQGLELVLIFPCADARPNAHDDDLSARAAEDVTNFQEQLRRSVRHLSASQGNSTERTEAWCTRLSGLTDLVDRYGLPASTNGSVVNLVEEENAMLHTLCDL